MSESSAAAATVSMTESLAAALKGAPVRVGTGNQAKCSAVRVALESLQSSARAAGAIPLTSDATPSPTPTPTSTSIAEIQIQPTPVASGVSEQPIGFEEIVAGARNRARAALAEGACVLAVGIEDGLVKLPDGLGGQSVFNLGCAWVSDGARESLGFSSGFAYPAECLEPAFAGQQPIGDLFDALWRRHRDPSERDPSGPHEGNIGRLTGGRLTRSDYGSHAVLCALVRFLQRDLYD